MESMNKSISRKNMRSTVIDSTESLKSKKAENRSFGLVIRCSFYKLEIKKQDYRVLSSEW